MGDILYDARWVGNHGIGRFARQLLTFLPEFRLFQAARRPSHPLDPALLAAALWLKRPGLFFSPGYNCPVGSPCAFVFTVHDLNHLLVPENSSAPKRAYYEHFVRPACRQAEFVLTVSECSRTAICDWAKVAPEKVVNVGNGVGWPFVASGAKYDPGFPYFLYVGNRKAHKNLARLLQAFAISGVRRQVGLVLTGSRDAPTSAAVERLGLNGDVRFAESPGDEGLAALYRGAVALVFPSLYEGFGLPALEGMACGTPVLTSNVSALPEIVGHAALLVNPGDVECIAEGMRKLAGDSNLRATLRARGPARARRFSWEETAKKVLEVLKAAAPRPRNVVGCS